MGTLISKHSTLLLDPFRGCLPFSTGATEAFSTLQTRRPAPCRYAIAGTWSGWKPRDMTWDGESFYSIVTVGNNQWEAFQVLLDGSWDTVVYPSIKDANPSKVYELRGPDNKNAGFNWLIGRAGFNPFKRDLIPPGTQYKVVLRVGRTGAALGLTWDLYEESAVSARELERLARDPPAVYHIAGTWSDWDKKPMSWDGSCFSYTARIGKNGWEAFQFLVDGSWDKVVYPSVKDAHPFMTYEFRGPDNQNKGYNWVIGSVGKLFRKSSDSILPGTRCQVKLFVTPEGKPRRVTWDFSHADRVNRPSVLCVAGLASGSLEACSGETAGQVSWVRVRELLKRPRTVLESLALKLVDDTLKDGTKVKSVVNKAVDVRPVRGVNGIKSLSPPGAIQIPVWGPLIDELEGDFKWHAFAYDWRRWGDLKFAEELVDRFRTEVEHILRQDRPSDGKLSLVGHSMGASVICYILSVIGDAWVRENIDQVILVAPAHMGSPSMVSSFAHCPFVDTQTWLPVPCVLDQKLGDLTATWACMIGELPMRVGGCAPWPEEHVFAKTPKREYRLDDMGQFLADLAECKPHREIGPALWPGVSRLAKAVRPPLVPTTIIYGGNVDTPAQVKYETLDLGAKPLLSKSEPGDGTIVAASVEAVSEYWVKRGAEVRMLKEPKEEMTSHKGLICCPFTASLLPKLLEHRRLTPISVTMSSASGLKNADHGPNNLSDPYCRVEIPGKPATKRETQVVQNCLDPKWDHTDTIFAYDDGDNLVFTIFDMDMGCTDGDLLGRAYLTADQVRTGFHGSLKLDGEPGTLHVKVKALPPM